MSSIKISLDSAGGAGDISVVRVDGVIDTMTATELEKVMNSLLERSKYRIIVDLGGVDYISSAGWGIFISNIREIRQHTGDIKLARMIPNVYEIFELLEFDSILRAFDSIEKAKGDFEGIDVEKTAVSEPVTASKTVRGNDGGKLGVSAAKNEPAVQTAKEKPAESAAVKTGDKTVVPDLQSLVLELVSKDPFYTVSEIKREIGRRHRGLKPGWWKIWGILRRNGLLTKKNRFRRARNKTEGV
jgi:anti-sigma B factor antagonist